jgi:hypothetical protein
MNTSTGMKGAKNARTAGRGVVVATLAFAFLAGAAGQGLAAADRVRIDVYGGLMLMNPRDFNLLGRAEEQYNYILFQERLIGWTDGFFTNAFPRLTKAFPAGLRLRYALKGRLDLSVEVEAFRRVEEARIAGTFAYDEAYTLTESKAYDPFRLGIRALSVLGGVQYRIEAGRSTEIEIGAAAGWAWARFDFLSSWTAALDLVSDGEVLNSSVDGVTLEGDGKGSAPAAKLMVRLNRAIGRNWGFFVETAASYCRIGSPAGGGRETVLDVPGETVWSGVWGVKREVIDLPYDSAVVLVPTNYWEGWVAGQRERDFVLDISGLRLAAGLYLRF